MVAMQCAWAISASPMPDNGDTPSGTPDMDLDPAGTILSGTSMKELVNQLKDVQAYVFLGKGEERNLNDVFGRSNTIVFKKGDLENPDVKCTITNPGIATLTNDGILKGGNEYGETIFTISRKVEKKDSNGSIVYDNNEPVMITEEFHFAVFVCPTVTVVSPEGVVYRYPKTHGQKARIQLSQGNDYLINCVMLKNGDGDWEDITSEVEAGKNEDNSPKNNEKDGYFEFADGDGVENDLIFILSEESYHPNNLGTENGKVVGSSGYNVRVYGNDFIAVVPDNAGADIIDTVMVEGLNGEFYRWSSYSGSDLPQDLKDAFIFTVKNPGIYKIHLYYVNDQNTHTEVPGVFKIMIPSNDQLSGLTH